MGEIIKFPTIQKSSSLDTSSEDTSHAHGTKVLDFKKRADFVIENRTIKACLFEGFPSVTVGREIHSTCIWEKAERNRFRYLTKR